MRKLSEFGVIEELTILTSKNFDDEKENEPPLTFNKLQTLRCRSDKYESNFWNFLTKSQIPTLDVFGYEYGFTEAGELLDGMVRFFESKLSLTTIFISITDTELKTIPFTFLRQIISILKEPIAKRPFLYLFIYPLHLSEVEVSKIACL